MGERDEHKKSFFFFLTQEKRDRINFKNVIVKVFEDAREGGGRR